MRYVTDKVHGVIDYAAAIALIAVPLAANFETVSPVAYWLSIAAGVSLFLYSLVTSYTYSAFRIISFKLHLALDFAAGLVFLAAPFAFSFGGVPRAFYFVAGTAVVFLVLFTNPKVEPGSEKTAEGDPDEVTDSSTSEETSSEESD